MTNQQHQTTRQAEPAAATSAIPPSWTIRDRSDLEPRAIDIEGPGHPRMTLTATHSNPAWRMLHMLGTALLQAHAPAAQAEPAQVAAEALCRVSRRAPCGHETLDTHIGDGKTWAKCEDCGATVEQARVPRARAAAAKFEDDIAVLRAALVRPAAQAEPDWKRDSRKAAEGQLAYYRDMMGQAREPI